MMRILVKWFSIGLVGLLVVGCARLPVASYTPQYNGVTTKINGNANIGLFTYLPFEQGRVTSNQIENTAVNNFYIEGDIAELAQRGTIIELERAGVNLNNSNLTILGKIKKFRADDLGFNIDWSYIINYKIVDKSGAIILDRDYIADPMRVSKWTITLQSVINNINSMIYSGYKKFIDDPDVRTLLAKGITR
ncbi:integrase [Pasteurella skyensis]|uniref:Integrase n=1 Tax=Phocoenobacter skyensis TaxID=97481 RepID=A0AAJ6N896_9PAST|nr:integrase [Pasteurella skyensis]MDP8161888.1 integrase [Pasteurella skyensis]MDP8172044.1 integrase [Pasteurella skyensis]MDP8176279.1 integrase [Pasteurella skyensis]MDP8178299.1 integrase [Pasteurella skyensis]MDP8182093.1 integrase [Pasteurella skyensis]